MGGIRIAIVDDHPIFRAGVAQSLLEHGGFEIVAQGGTRDDALRIVEKCDPGVLLLDVSIPGGGLEALKAIVLKHPGQKVVMLTVSESGGDVTRAMRAGARGYVLKGIEAGSLAQVLESVAAGERYVSPALSARLLSDGIEPGEPNGVSPVDALDKRQRRILDLVSSGLSNKEIAIELDLHEKTIKHQMTRIFAKLAVSNRTEAAMVFRDALQPPLATESGGAIGHSPRNARPD
ncbi:MAG: response regulator transcription factor [Pseudomonadota bacterium]|nr:response regulator transcription factor [Pseudomonadota bacterium]